MALDSFPLPRVRVALERELGETDLRLLDLFWSEELLAEACSSAAIPRV